MQAHRALSAVVHTCGIQTPSTLTLSEFARMQGEVGHIKSCVQRPRAAAKRAQCRQRRNAEARTKGTAGGMQALHAYYACGLLQRVRDAASAAALHSGCNTKQVALERRRRMCSAFAGCRNACTAKLAPYGCRANKNRSMWQSECRSPMCPAPARRCNTCAAPRAPRRCRADKT